MVTGDPHDPAGAEWAHGDQRSVLLYTSEPDAVRAAFRDIFGWKHVDDGDGWLIFALPPAELGIHPAEGPTFDRGVRHQLTLSATTSSPPARS